MTDLEIIKENELNPALYKSSLERARREVIAAAERMAKRNEELEKQNHDLFQQNSIDNKTLMDIEKNGGSKISFYVKEIKQLKSELATKSITCKECKRNKSCRRLVRLNVESLEQFVLDYCSYAIAKEGQ